MDVNRDNGPQAGGEPRVLGPFDRTLDARLDDSGDVVCDPSPCVRLVEGSGLELSGETNYVLRNRLRASALVLLMGFTVFILWRMIGTAIGVAPELIDGTLFAQVLVVLTLIGVAMSLCRQCEVSGRMLRICELLTFGAPALFFFFLQFTMMRQCAVEERMIPQAPSAWLMLMFTYAMFIPNSWKRAAVAIGSMAVAPILLTGLLWSTDSLCAHLITSDWWGVVMMVLTVFVSAVASVIGVHTINTLRTEAYEARQLGQYKLGRQLGSGGMGEVYQAEHQLMKRPCAIKIIRPEKAGDPRTLARFEREVRSTAKLSHWNNIDIFDYGRAADGTCYYVMEFLPGLSLDDLIESYGPMCSERVIYLLRQTCDALSEAHGIGLIHRDIKPANIFAAVRGGQYDVAKLLDFGMVKPIDGLDQADLTMDGTITGSPLYMAPEQVVGDARPDPRTDIYALGTVAYHLLAGRPPFEGTQAVKVLVAHANTPPTPISDLQPDVPHDLEAIVMRCLAKQPEDRFTSTAELADALDACETAGRWDSRSAASWWASIGIDATVEQPVEV